MREPDFFIVGAPKCGTTAMNEYLKKHPDIFIPYRKEPHFFGSDLESNWWFDSDSERYFSLFSDARNEKRVGEASVYYMYSKRAAAEIKEFAPSGKIIVMLRNPVDMIYSYHSACLYNGNEDIADFEEALEAEQDRREGHRVPPGAPFPEGLFYSRIAMYSEQLQRYIDIFGWDNVHIIIFDDFKNDTAGVYRKTLRFLGVQEDSQTTFKTINPNKRVRNNALQEFLQKPPEPVRILARTLLPRRRLRFSLVQALSASNTRYEQRSEMDPELRRHLQNEFAPEVERLGNLIGRDLSHWSRS